MDRRTGRWIRSSPVPRSVFSPSLSLSLSLYHVVLRLKGRVPSRGWPSLTPMDMDSANDVIVVTSGTFAYLALFFCLTDVSHALFSRR
jgi:hypothetical protein